MAVETTVEVVMPAMGDSVSEGTILEWRKQEGDQVSEDETLVEISTDKVDAEVPAPASGTVVKLHVSEGVILEWAKQPGDPVEADETIVEISTDKVDAEVPAPASGVMEEILANPGDTVTVGQVIGRMKSGANGAAAPAPPPEAPAEAPPTGQAEVALPDGIRVSPVARRVAAAEGIDLSNV